MIDFAQCDVNDVTIPHELYILRKNIVCYVINYREGYYEFRNGNIDGYIIKLKRVFNDLTLDMKFILLFDFVSPSAYQGCLTSEMKFICNLKYIGFSVYYNISLVFEHVSFKS